MRKRSLLFLIFLMFVFISAVPAQDAVQTQPSSDGTFEAALLSVKVRVNVLTVKVALKNTANKKISPMFFFKDVYYADIEQGKKYFGLKDAEGNYIAGTKFSNEHGGRFWSDMDPNGKQIVWIKFPAPAETTRTIDIFIPGLLPFEEVEVQR